MEIYLKKWFVMISYYCRLVGLFQSLDINYFLLRIKEQKLSIKQQRRMFPMMNMKIDLIQQQKNLFLKIFSKTDTTWKIIIFDESNHDLMSSLFKVKDMRENNITLLFNITQQRQQLHGVTAIYLVKPNEENVELVIKDLEKELYSSVVIHFSSQPKSDFFSFFAKKLAKRKSSAMEKIQKVQYSNLGFQCIDRQMCILPENNELINLLVALKNEPLFIFSQNDQTQVEIIKQRLMNSAFNLTENKKSSISQISKKNQKKYTRVLIFNRENDLFPVISHGITYASLMEDIWRFNRLGNKLLDKASQIDLNDQIWLQRKNMLISEMDLEKQFNKIKIKLNSASNNVEEASELNEKNKKVQWHLNMAGEMIKQAKKRRLNEFHAVEEELYIKKILTGQNKTQFMELLSTGPQQNDKIRLILTYMLSVQNNDQNQVQEIQKLCPDVKQNNLYNEIKIKRTKDDGAQSNLNSSKYIKKLAKGIWKNLVNEEKKFLLIKYLQNIRDLSQKNLNDLGLKMDILNEVSLDDEIENTVVYCVGGICFNEYANLSQFHPNVIYCGDKFINYREFI